MVSAALLWSIGWFEPASPELRAYVGRPDASFRWSEKHMQGHRSLDLVSQTWQGKEWRHDLVIVDPTAKANAPDTAIIEVTGWEPNKTDLDDAQVLANHALMPVAVLFHVPSQPLWGFEEDDLIAHTFEKFIETGDPEWLLLFPMVKSVKAAMDAIEQATGIKKFVVTGASKRGWTSWLVGALGDDCVVGIAPRVFDNLDFPKQLAQQKAYWGGFSPMIGDYTERGLQDLLATEPGQNLIRLVDPLAAIRDLRAPVLSITGTNDPYWTVDSTQVYWDRIPSPKWTLAVPNSGHVLTEKAWWLNALGQFATQCSRGKVQNLFSTSTQPNGLEVHCAVPPTSYRVWMASSSDLHFNEKKWRAEDPVTLKSTEASVLIRVEVLRDTNTALLVEMEFPGGLRLTTPVHLVRKK